MIKGGHSTLCWIIKVNYFRFSCFLIYVFLWMHSCSASQFMDPWAMTKKALHQCGGDTSSCLCPYPLAACPKFHVGCSLGRELFTLPLYIDWKFLPTGAWTSAAFYSMCSNYDHRILLNDLRKNQSQFISILTFIIFYVNTV